MTLPYEVCIIRHYVPAYKISICGYVVPYSYVNVIMYTDANIKYYDSMYFSLNYPSCKMHFNLKVSPGQKQ